MKKLLHNFLYGVITLVTLCAFALPANAESIKYTFSDYTAGTQYADNEVHKLDDYLTVTTTDCHFTTDLRIYDSSQYDGLAVFESTVDMASIVINAGNTANTLNVYTSTDGSTWVLKKGVSVSKSYADYTVDLGATKYIKFDAVGGQIRAKYITVTYAEASNPSLADPELAFSANELTFNLFGGGYL